MKSTDHLSQNGDEYEDSNSLNNIAKHIYSYIENPHTLPNSSNNTGIQPENMKFKNPSNKLYQNTKNTLPKYSNTVPYNNIPKTDQIINKTDPPYCYENNDLYVGDDTFIYNYTYET